MAPISIHLRLLAGADNRYAYLRDTVRVSRPYFATISVLDTGSTDETAALGRSDGVHYRRLPGWRDDWPLAYSQALRGIPRGDWFLFLDSDERPSSYLLENLSADVQELERRGFNCAYLPSLYHRAGEPSAANVNDPGALLENWPRSHDEFVRQPCWTKKNLIKLTPSTHVRARGAHCSYHQWPELGCYLPRFYNHYKSAREVAASTVLCSWSCPEAYGVPRDAPEWERHHTLRERTGLRTASDMLIAARAGTLAPEWLAFWETLEASPYPALVEYWKFAFTFCFSTQAEATRCGKLCCRYRDQQL